MPPVDRLTPDNRSPARQGRVTAICIFHDNAAFLAEAIESVLGQTYRDFELLLVDDGSTDGSSEIAQRYASQHAGTITYVHHPGHENRGMSATRNLGLTRARGEFVAFIDGDDRWRPKKLEEQVALIDAHPDVVMVSGGFCWWHSWNQGEDRTGLSGHVVNRVSYPPETSLRLYPLGRALNPTNPLIRRAVIEKVGGYEDRFRGLYEDQVFLAKLYLEGGVYFSSRVWLDYRQHPDSCTARTTRGDWQRARGEFLEWYEGYIRERQVPWIDELDRGIARARWQVAHFRLFRASRKLRRWAVAWLRALKLKNPAPIPDED